MEKTNMKIAIQGHESRGKEVIQILESLGGKNIHELCGNGKDYEHYYHINTCGIITLSSKYDLHNYKFYTLEEFEEEFPFKIGDKVIFPANIGWMSGKITGLTYVEDQLKYEVDRGTHYYHYVEPRILQLYSMKKERNITLTLDKAKEWYKKGGELREIALQAFTEKELTKVDLPKTWEEFCENYPVQKGECWLSDADDILQCSYSQHRTNKNWIPSKKSAEAHLAMMQLEQLRNCWWNGWKPIWGISQKWCIRLFNGVPSVGITTNISKFLIFPTKEMAEDFLECFRDLIEKAGDLI